MYYTYYMAKITTVRLDDALLDSMKKLTERDGIPTSEQIRRALNEWLKMKGMHAAPKKKRGAK